MSDWNFYHARTGNSLRAAIAVELADLDVQRHELNLSEKDQKQDWFLDINPAGTVPVLVESGGDVPLVLTQSGAIMETLISRHRPDLWPTAHAARSRCMASFMAALSDIAVPNAFALYLEFAPEASAFVLDRLFKSIQDVFVIAKEQPFLCGQSKTIADYAHLPVVYMREHALSTRPEFGHVLNWLERMRHDPAIESAIAYSGVQFQRR